MQSKIVKGTVYKYVGPGDGRGIRHLVTSYEHGEVTTWSDPTKNPEEGGVSWMGPSTLFVEYFSAC